MNLAASFNPRKICSHLELTVEFTEKGRKRYQDFNGPQPGVLDRIK